MADKPAEKKVKKVIDGKVVRRKKPSSSQMSESLGRAWRYILSDVLLPAAKDMLHDAITEGSSAVIYGEEKASSVARKTKKSSGHTSYHSIASDKSRYNSDRPRAMTPKARATHNFDDIILDTRSEAEDVIEQLFTLVSQFDTATVADLYGMLGIESKFTDDKWGWVDMRGACSRRTRHGFKLELPDPVYLD